MVSVTFKESAAASAVGTNLFSGNQFQGSTRFRKVNRIGVVGSSAAANAAVDLFYGSTKVGTFYNTTLGAVAPLEAKDLVPVAGTLLCDPGELINVLVNTASTTNPFVITLEIQEF